MSSTDPAPDESGCGGDADVPGVQLVASRQVPLGGRAEPHDQRARHRALRAHTDRAHTDRAHTDRAHTDRLRGVQLWVALPAVEQHGGPAFAQHTDLPTADLGGARASVFVGGRHGRRFAEVPGGEPRLPAPALPNARLRPRRR